MPKPTSHPGEVRSGVTTIQDLSKEKAEPKSEPVGNPGVTGKTVRKGDFKAAVRGSARAKAKKAPKVNTPAGIATLRKEASEKLRREIIAIDAMINARTEARHMTEAAEKQAATDPRIAEGSLVKAAVLYEQSFFYTKERYDMKPGDASISSPVQWAIEDAEQAINLWERVGRSKEAKGVAAKLIPLINKLEMDLAMGKSIFSGAYYAEQRMVLNLRYGTLAEAASAATHARTLSSYAGSTFRADSPYAHVIPASERKMGINEAELLALQQLQNGDKAGAVYILQERVITPLRNMANLYTVIAIAYNGTTNTLLGDWARSLGERDAKTAKALEDYCTKLGVLLAKR